MGSQIRWHFRLLLHIPIKGNIKSEAYRSWEIRFLRTLVRLNEGRNLNAPNIISCFLSWKQNTLAINLNHQIYPAVSIQTLCVSGQVALPLVSKWYLLRIFCYAASCKGSACCLVFGTLIRLKWRSVIQNWVLVLNVSWVVQGICLV